MGNPSNWISELKYVDFGVFEIFFWKIIYFRWKNEKKKILLILFVPKRSKTDTRQNLLLFLPHKPIRAGKTGQIRDFRPFSVIFGDFHLGPILGGTTSPNCHFLPGIWKYDVWSPSGCIELIVKPVGHTH